MKIAKTPLQRAIAGRPPNFASTDGQADLALTDRSPKTERLLSVIDEMILQRPNSDEVSFARPY